MEGGTDGTGEVVFDAWCKGEVVTAANGRAVATGNDKTGEDVDDISKIGADGNGRVQAVRGSEEGPGADVPGADVSGRAGKDEEGRAMVDDRG